MIIKTTYISKSTGKEGDVQYEEVDSFEGIKHLPVLAAGAFCFCGDQMVLVYASKRNEWEIPGGGREDGESFDECIIREIREESNMRVVELIPLGYDTFTYPDNDTRYVLRYVAKVEPHGEFKGDGAEDAEITAIKLIDPSDYKQYFDWGERSDAMMAKALKLSGVEKAE